MAEERRTWVPIAAAAALAVAGVVAVLVTAQFNTSGAPTCATSVKASSPFVAPARFAEDERLAALGAAVDQMPAPFGPVRAGVGYNYDQWLHLYGLNGGLLTFTKDNAPLTLLDGTTLKARWALRPETKRIAWDASADRLALLDLSAKRRVRVGSYDLASGKEQWCVELSAKHRDGQPVSTTFLDDGDLLVVLPVDGGLDVARMSADDGHVAWFNGLERAGRADYLGQLDDSSFVVGGTEEYRLATPEKPAPGGSDVSAYSLKGEPLWTWAPERGALAHVVGVVRGSEPVVVVLATRGTSPVRLTGLGSGGTVLWSQHLKGPVTQATLRGTTVVLGSRTILRSHDARTGKPGWFRELPTDRTFLPYGFTLGQMPSLDETHLLVPTTTALEVLDLTTGKHVDHPLPTDGVSTTYWPYQLAFTGDLLGVVTNTGGVVAEFEPDPPASVEE